MWRNLPAPGSGAARVGVLTASGPGSTLLLPELVLETARRARLVGTALLRASGLAAALRCGSGLARAIHLRTAARLIFAIL